MCSTAISFKTQYYMELDRRKIGIFRWCRGDLTRRFSNSFTFRAVET